MGQELIPSRGVVPSLLLKPDGVYLQVEMKEEILFSATKEELYEDLRFRRIDFFEDKVERCFLELPVEPLKISSQIEGIITKPILKLKVSPDKIKAYLLVKRSLPGQALSEREILDYLGQQRIAEELLLPIIPQISSSQESYTAWLVALGQPSQDGENAALDFHFNPKGIDVKPQELADGSVDFYNLNLIQIVKPGTLLVTKRMATPGKKGKDVFGQEIVAQNGKDIRLPVGLNTQAINENTAVIASCEGHVVFVNGRVNIYDSYEVRGDVDFNIGNVSFPGNVVVYGSIKSGFEVSAQGDVEVHGNLEGNIKARGNVQIKKGILRGKVFAGGCVYARSLENGYIESGGDVIISEAIMHSSVKAVKKVIVGGRKGLIAGGNCSAGEEISAKNVGSSLATATILEVGIRPEQREEYKIISRQLQTNLENTQKIIKGISFLQELKQKIGSLPQDKADLLLQFNRNKHQIAHQNEDLVKRKLELEGQFRDLEKAVVKVESFVFPGVTIIIGNATYNNRDEMRRVQFKLEGLEVKSYPLK